MYDYLIVGAGLSGAIFAHEATKRGKKKSDWQAGSHRWEYLLWRSWRINVHKYGAHIFHTSNKRFGIMLTNLLNLTTIINSPVANYKVALQSSLQHEYLYAMWGTKTPQEVKDKIADKRRYERCLNRRTLRTGHQVDWSRYLWKVDQGLYGEAMGTFCNRPASFHH